jgi:amidase
MHVPIALGTQTGGSIVRPASFNGVFAMKPTWGAISTEGQKVFSGVFDTIGFFARSVEDLQLLADVFQLRDDSLPRPIDIGSSSFAVLKTVQWKHVQAGTVESMETATRLLRSEGAIVQEITLPSDFDDLHLWHKQTMNTDGSVTFYSDYCNNKDKLPEVIIGYVENKQGYTHSVRLGAMDSIARLRPLIDEILSKYTAIITPSTPGEAPVGLNTGSPVFNTFWTVGKSAPPLVFKD